MNSVKYILEHRPLSFDEKVEIKKLGRPTPDLQIKSTVVCKTREFNRYFKRETTYNRFPWLCGCPDTKKFFCFVCLLSNDLKPSPWIQPGVDDLRHLNDRAIKHSNSVTHMNHSVDFNILATVDIRKQLDSAYVTSVRLHNEKVNKNRHILRRLIMCIKFCGAFELALRGHDERVDSQNPGIFRGLVDFAAELDSVLNVHLTKATVFKGTSKTIQNELLDAMLEVCKRELKDQIEKARFLAVEADETTDSHNQQQLVVIFRYTLDGNIYERFWGYIRPQGHNAENISDAILKELDSLGVPPTKLIAQSYDGASVMSGTTGGVQAIIRQKYPYAYFIHCYAHQFNLILEKAASCHKKLKIFFADIQSFATFFSQSAKRTAFLDEIANRRLPRAVPTRWNFKSRTINSIYENKEMLAECLEKIIDDSKDGKTMAQANGLLRNLSTADFNFFLEALHYITPQVEIFLNQIQSRCADSAYIRKCVIHFETHVSEIRNHKIDSLFEQAQTENGNQQAKRQRIELPESNRIILKEYCDILIAQIKDRYQYTGHLAASSLFLPDMFQNYKKTFPQELFEETVTAYPFINSAKLKSELTVIYNREDMCGNRDINGILPLLLFIIKNNLKECLSEIYTLLEIICTTPMTTCECERCFSTLKRIKCLLRSTMTQDRLNALSMLSIEKQMVHDISDFDNKVIEVFANSKDRRLDFKYQ